MPSWPYGQYNGIVAIRLKYAHGRHFILASAAGASVIGRSRQAPRATASDKPARQSMPSSTSARAIEHGAEMSNASGHHTSRRACELRHAISEPPICAYARFQTSAQCAQHASRRCASLDYQRPARAEIDSAAQRVCYAGDYRRCCSHEPLFPDALHQMLISR